MNDKKELEYLIIHLTSEPFLLDLSKHMRDKLKGMIEQEIAEIEYYCNGPSEAELEFEQSLLDQEDDDQPINYPTDEQLDEELRLQEEWDAIILASQ